MRRGETDEYWRGYKAALDDLERALQVGRHPIDWKVQTTIKFGLEDEPPRDRIVGSDEHGREIGRQV